MRTLSGAMLLSTAAICLTIGSVFRRSGKIEPAIAASVLSGALGLALLVWGLIAEGRDSGSNS